MSITVPTKYLFCIYSPKKDDYMIAAFPTYQLAEYELSRLQTDEFFSDSLVSGPIVADVADSFSNGRYHFILDQKSSNFYPLQEIVSYLQKVKEDLLDDRLPF